MGRLTLVTRAVGLELGLGTIFFSGAAASLLLAFPTPGGLGAVDGGIIGLLRVAGGVSAGPAGSGGDHRSVHFLLVRHGHRRGDVCVDANEAVGHPVRVGIDYTSAATQREGIGRATRELVNAMLRLPDCPDLQLMYAHRGPVPAADALGVHERVKLRRLPLSPRVMLAGWYKARLPLPIEALLGPLHVMHGPDFVLPPRLAAAGVVTVHDLAFATRPEDAHPAQRRFLESAVPWSIDRARLVVAVSETTRRDLMTRYGVRPHRIRVVPNAVSSEFHERDGAEVLAEVRRRLRLPEEYLLSVGTIHPRKNLAGTGPSRRAERPAPRAGRCPWCTWDAKAGCASECLPTSSRPDRPAFASSARPATPRCARSIARRPRWCIRASPRALAFRFWRRLPAACRR